MLLEIKNLEKRFKTGRLKKKQAVVLSKINLILRKGETTGIVGESGAGKTTLGLILAGLIKPDKGQILFKGKKIDSLTKEGKKEYRRQIQVVFQHPESTFNPKWKMKQSFLEPFKIHRIPFSEKIILKHLSRVGLNTEILNRYPSQLSGGELQRIAISRVMSLNPAIIVLDEPTSMLDNITQAQIIRLLEKIQKQKGVSYLFISHDPDLVRLFCKRIYELDRARGLNNLETGTK